MPRKTSPTSLPQLPETWNVAIRQTKQWVNIQGEMAGRAYMMLVTLPEQELVLAGDIFPKFPEKDEILEKLIKAISKPEKLADIKPHRPQKMVFEDDQLAQALAPALEEIEIEVGVQARMAEMDFLAEKFANYMLGEEPEPPNLLSVEGNTPELIGRVFGAAAAYYRSAPWRFLADGQPLAVHFSPADRQGFVQLMGNAGIQFGIIFHWKWEDLLRTYEMDDDPLKQIPADGLNSLSYEESSVIVSADLDGIEQYGWEVAGPNAYPLPVIYFAERVERPGPEMLAFYEATLRAVPQFVEYLKPDENDDYLPLERTFEIETGRGLMDVTVRYPAGELPAMIFLGEGTEEEDDFENEFFFEEDLEEEEDDEFEDFDEEEDLFFDERILESELAQISQALELAGGNQSLLSPEVNQAQQIIYRAFREQKPGRRVLLARQALEISPDCADAYVLLAEEEAETPEEAGELYEKGMHAGERALGEDYFIQNSGKFWGLIETRGYMRARQGLAENLEYLDRENEAISHYEALLRLNPEDNQGVRYQLLNLLVRLEQNEDAGELLKRYDQDASAVWTYTRALLAFRQRGPSAHADAALRRAIRQNPYAPPYLSGAKPLPEEQPDFISFGDESEAIDYALQHFGNWWHTRGAVAWLKEISKGTKKAKTTKRKSRRS
jgi:tetratricopeptide (TPR) repeat protein